MEQTNEIVQEYMLRQNYIKALRENERLKSQLEEGYSQVEHDFKNLRLRMIMVVSLAIISIILSIYILITR